jgi:hypothetical protein
MCGISGRFQRISPPPLLPQLLQPTSTGTIVCCPPTSVVSHVLPVHMAFVVASVENPGGKVVIVDVMLSEPVAVIAPWHDRTDAAIGGHDGRGGNGGAVHPKVHGYAQPHPLADG